MTRTVTQSRLRVAINGLKLVEGAHRSLGGNYYHVRYLVEALLAYDNLEITVLTDKHTHPHFVRDLPSARLHLMAEGGDSVLAADVAVWCYVRRFRPDIYHRPTGQLPLWPLACQTVTTIADLNFMNLPTPWLKKWYKRTSYHWTMRRADRVTAISAYTKGEMVRHLGVAAAKVEVISHGANSLPPPVFEVSESIGRPYYLTFGHQAHKNVPAAVRALFLLNGLGSSGYHLAVIGTHEVLDREVRPLVEELGLEGQVHFLGRVSAETLHALYLRAVALVFPTKYEGFGLPVLEAMKAGCPVVASNVCSLPEIAGDAAMLVTPDDHQGIAAAMAAFADDQRLRDEFVQKGLRRSAQFTWAAAAEKTMRLYHDLAADRLA